jgi:type IV pilus assembly protein PilY1
MYSQQPLLKARLGARCMFAAGWLLALALFSGATLAQQPAQEPLLARTQSVRPNLSVMFDDSLSMRFTCNYTRNVLEKAATTYGGLGISVGCRNTGSFADLSLSVMSADNPIYNSYATNELAYDPRKVYRPPLRDGLSRFDKASIATEFPKAATVQTRLDFTSPTRYSFSNPIAPPEVFFTSDAYPTIPADPVGTWKLIFLPKVGFNPETASLSALQNNSNYDTISVGTGNFFWRPAGETFFTITGGTNPLAKPSTRTDCTANASYCTLTEERQNIANWNLFYRNRLLAFQAGVAEAFAGLPDTFRFNYTTLGQALTQPSGSGRVARGIDDFGGIPSLRQYKDGLPDFYTWLFAETGNGFNTSAQVGTPLRQAYDRLGRYYFNNTDNSGPWGSTPWTTNSETAAQHLSCRKSFAILATDGQWNNGSFGFAIPASILGADVDGTTGPAISDSPVTATFQYTPGNTNEFTRGKRDRDGTGNSETLADTAMYFWLNDLRSGSAALTNNVSDGKFSNGPFWQHLNLTTVAFGAGGTLSPAQLAQARLGEIAWPAPAANQSTAIDDLAHAAHNGGGDFLSVGDAQTFADRLRDKLLAISGEELSQAGVVGSTQALTAGSLKIEATYESGRWWGNLSAVEINPTNAREVGIKWRVVELNGDGRPTGVTTIPSPITRDIYTYVNDSTAPVEFKFANLGSNSLIGSATNQLITGWSAAQTDFIRGVRTQEGDEKPFRARTSILGDIVNSTPVFVKDTTVDRYSQWGSADEQTKYTEYKADKARRGNGLILVGANDGMLHAFREQDGNEIFAYIPRAVLGKLHLLTEKDYGVKHKYFVDGPLNEVDAFIRTPNSGGVKPTLPRWSNVVLGTTGAGAKAVFAIDTTEHTNLRGTDILWEVNDSVTGFTNDLGYITQRVQAGVTASGDWVAVFGNGVNSNSGLGKLFILNLETGAIIKTINTDSTTGNGLGGVRLVRNEKGTVIGAYAGDIRGRMWRFDLSATSSSTWPDDGQLLFEAPTTTASGTTTTALSAITAAPAAYGRTDGRRGYIVVFATGKLLDVADTTTPHPVQRAYGIADVSPFGSTDTFRTAEFSKLVASAASTTSTTADATVTTFFQVATSATIDWANQHGWRLDLTLSDGQRQIYPVEPLRGLVQLQTVAPRALSANACTVDGQARGFNLIIDPLRGGCRSGKTLDTNQDNVVDDKDSGACGWSTFGDGVNANFSREDDRRDPEDVVTPTSNPPCRAGEIYSVDTSANAQLIKTCDKPTEEDPTTDFRRTVRQIFIRP